MSKTNTGAVRPLDRVGPGHSIGLTRILTTNQIFP
jgi:hypothetical protein